MSTRTLTIAIAAVLVIGIAVITITAGGEDDSGDAKATDGAFIVEMIPHHESAIEMAEIAREVSATVAPMSAASALAPWLGLIIHFLLSLALALVFARVVGNRLRGAALLAASVGTLAAVWAFNFFVLLPAINPEFVTRLPYGVTLVSKLLFGVGMALVLDRDRTASS